MPDELRVAAGTPFTSSWIAPRDLRSVLWPGRPADRVVREALATTFADVLLAGDLALRHAVQRLYGLDHLPTEGEMVEVAERWRPYRSLAVSYLFSSEFEERG